MAAAQLNDCKKELTLNTGAKIPLVGLGTWKSEDNEAYEAVLHALKHGYRHIDGAAIYLNEQEVGKAIRDSGVPREEIFVTTKLWGTQHRDPAKALDESLQRLGLDYVDLYLMHWPVALKTDTIKDGNMLTIPVNSQGQRDVDIEEWDYTKTWELMQDLPKTGKTKSVGVSNFSIKNLQKLQDKKLPVPACNQIEIHPLLPQWELVEFCQKNGIVVEAYSPLGGTKALLIKEPAVVEIAEKLQVNPGQVLISWGVQRGYVVLPKSVKPSRIESNLKVFTLPKEDMERLNNLSKEIGEKRIVDMDWKPFPTFE